MEDREQLQKRVSGGRRKEGEEWSGGGGKPERGRKQERERARSVTHSPIACNGCSHSGSWGLSPGLPLDQSPTASGRVHVSKKLQSEAESELEARHSETWDVGVPSVA